MAVWALDVFTYSQTSNSYIGKFQVWQEVGQAEAELGPIFREYRRIFVSSALGILLHTSCYTRNPISIHHVALYFLSDIIAVTAFSFTPVFSPDNAAHTHITNHLLALSAVTAEASIAGLPRVIANFAAH